MNPEVQTPPAQVFCSKASWLQTHLFRLSVYLWISRVGRKNAARCLLSIQLVAGCLGLLLPSEVGIGSSQQGGVMSHSYLLHEALQWGVLGEMAPTCSSCLLWIKMFASLNYSHEQKAAESVASNKQKCIKTSWKWSNLSACVGFCSRARVNPATLRRFGGWTRTHIITYHLIHYAAAGKKQVTASGCCF